MTTKKKLPEFAPGAVDGLLPPMKVAAPAAAPAAPSAPTRPIPPPPAATSTQGATPGAASPSSVDTEAAAAPAPRRTRRRPSTAKYSQSTFDIDAAVMRRVQAEHAKRNAGRVSVSYIVLLLEAISNHGAELESAWRSPAAAPQAGGDLFARLNENAKEKRPPTAKLTLAGMRPEERNGLDELVTKWGAPTLTALIEQAFRLEYPETAGRRSRS